MGFYSLLVKSETTRRQSRFTLRNSAQPRTKTHAIYIASAHMMPYPSPQIPQQNRQHRLAHHFSEKKYPLQYARDWLA